MSILTPNPLFPGHLQENRRNPTPLGRGPTLPKKVERGPGIAPTLPSHLWERREELGPRRGQWMGEDTKGKGMVRAEICRAIPTPAGAWAWDSFSTDLSKTLGFLPLPQNPVHSCWRANWGRVGEVLRSLHTCHFPSTFPSRPASSPPEQDAHITLVKVLWPLPVFPLPPGRPPLAGAGGEKCPPGMGHSL